MPAKSPPFYVLTGGPGAGKTTLIEALAGHGISVVAESGRDIIRAETARDGAALPWRDRTAFAEAMLAQDLAAYQAAAHRSAPVVFDRGIPDVLGYLRLEGLEAPERLLRAVAQYRYRTPVFICPPWPEIYSTDAERKQSPEIARRTHDMMRDIYHELGYALVEVPRAPVHERLRFIIDAIDAE